MIVDPNTEHNLKRWVALCMGGDFDKHRLNHALFISDDEVEMLDFIEVELKKVPALQDTSKVNKIKAKLTSAINGRIDANEQTAAESERQIRENQRRKRELDESIQVELKAFLSTVDSMAAEVGFEGYRPDYLQAPYFELLRGAKLQSTQNDIGAE